MISLICGTLKNDTNELIYKTETYRLQKQTYGYPNKLMVTKEER